MTLCPALLSVPFGSTARADSVDYTVTIDHDFLARTIEESVNEEINAKDSALYWRDDTHVAVKQDGSAYIAAHLNLMYEVKAVDDPNIDVDFSIWFHCNYENPSLSMSVGPLDVEANYPWWVDIATGGLSLALDTVENQMT